MRAISIFIAVILLLFLTTTYTSCKKEYSYEGGTAVFTFLADSGNCSNAVVSGIYAPGVALQPADTVQLRVNVTATGRYAFTTNTADGIQFKASGSFKVLGIQTVTLTGVGKPSSAGTFSFISSIGEGCAFPVAIQQAVPEVARYTLAGSPNACSEIILNGTYTAGFPLVANNTVAVMVDVTSIGSYFIATDTLDGVSFSSSGSFTVTGIQRVILKGSGTPQIPGNLTFTPNAGLSTCTFDLAVVTPGPPATYVLESNQDGSCTGYSVSGNFFAGEALTTTNTMAVKVTVTILGNYAITTNTVNGMTFAGTGSFVTKGSQIVVLTGSGRPVSKGKFGFTPQIIGPHPIGGETCTTIVEVL